MLQNLTHHLLQAGMWFETHQALTSLDYLQEKRNRSELGTYEIIQELKAVLESIPVTEFAAQIQDLTALHRIILIEQRTWFGENKQIFPQLYPHLIRSHASNLRRLALNYVGFLKERKVPWFCRVDPPTVPGNLTTQHREDIDESDEIHFSVVAKGKFAFASNRIVIWDLKTGLLDEVLDIRGGVQAFASYGDGKFIFGGKRGYSPSLLDAKKRSIKESLLDEWISGIAVLSDGRVFVAGARGTQSIWNPLQGDCISLLNSEEEITACHPCINGGYIRGTKQGKFTLTILPLIAANYCLIQETRSPLSLLILKGR